jgi:hypothetical protein
MEKQNSVQNVPLSHRIRECRKRVDSPATV